MQTAHVAQHQKSKQPNRKTGQWSKWTLLQEGIQMARELREKGLRIPVKEMPTKTAPRNLLKPVRRALFKKSANNSGKGLKKS